METAKPTDKAAPGVSPGAKDSAEQNKKRRGPNPTQNLLRAKKKLDQVIQQVISFPDLVQEASNLRSKVFQRFVEEEENIGPPFGDRMS